MTRGVGGRSPANIARSLKGIHFPVGKRDLVEHAKMNGAPSEVTRAIEAMPEQRYETMADVMKGFKQAEWALRTNRSGSAPPSADRSFRAPRAA